jgi:hypothetical protein
MKLLNLKIKGCGFCPYCHYACENNGAEFYECVFFQERSSSAPFRKTIGFIGAVLPNEKLFEPDKIAEFCPLPDMSKMEEIKYTMGYDTTPM